MKFSIEDKEYEFDPRLSVKEAIYIKDKTGLGTSAFLRGLFSDDIDPYAVAAMMYTLKRRAGEAVQWSDMMELNIFSFTLVDEEGDNPEGEESEGEADASNADEKPAAKSKAKRGADADPTQENGTSPSSEGSST